MTRRRGRRSVAPVLVLLALGALVLGTSGGVAAAHGDEGRMQLEATASGSLQAFVRATVIYANDDDPALGASVSVDATGPGGSTVPATPLVEVGDGRYEATLTFPVAGAWTVRATATDPAATGEVAFTATAAVPATTTTTAPDVELAEPRRVTNEADDDGSSLVLPIVALVVLGVGGGVGAWILQRRRAGAASGQ